MRIICFILICLVSLFLCPFVSADEKPSYLRFMTLGTLPVWGHDKYLSLPLGNEKIDMPPSEASLVSGDTLIPIKLALRSLTEWVAVKPGTEANQRVQCFFFNAELERRGEKKIQLSYFPETIPKLSGKADAKQSGK